MEKKTIRILVAVSVIVIVIGAIIGTVLGLLLRHQYVELEVWPRTEEYNGNRPLIYFKLRHPDTWNQRVNDFLKEYRQKGRGSDENPGAENRVSCSFSTGPGGEEKVCDVQVDDLYPCEHTDQYNYDQGSLCVYLKLNKIFNWKPQPYNNTEELPGLMPEDLKQHIKMVSGKPEANTVWVSCEGENPADVQNIGPIQYIPRRGFPAYYYPFTNKEGYLSPLVAVLIEKPRTGVLINIECKAWAKNIIYDRYEQHGSVVFGLMVDRN